MPLRLLVSPVEPIEMSNTADQAHVFTTPPLPECIYQSRDEAESALPKGTIEHGYSVSKKNAGYVKSTKIIHTQYCECEWACKPETLVIFSIGNVYVRCVGKDKWVPDDDEIFYCSQGANQRSVGYCSP